MATVGGKLFYTSNSKKFMNHSCTNIQFSDVLKEQPQPKARALGPLLPPTARPHAPQLQELHIGPLFCLKLNNSKGRKAITYGPNLASAEDLPSLGERTTHYETIFRGLKK